MPLVQAKCTNCGANIQVDNTKDAAICPYCGSAFIIEKAINLFAGNNYGAIYAETINIYENPPEKVNEHYVSANITPVVPSKDVLDRVNLIDKFQDSVQWCYRHNLVYLKSDGTLGLLDNWDGDPIPFTWKRLKKFLIWNYDIGEHINIPIVVGLTFNGKCKVSSVEYYIYGDYKQEHIYDAIGTWTEISNIYYFNSSVIGIKNDGTIVSVPNIPEISSWRGIKKIIQTRLGELIGITINGSIVSTIKNDYIRKLLGKWDNIVDIVEFNRGQIAGLKKDGSVVTTGLESINLKNVLKLYGTDLGNLYGIFVDGSVFEYPTQISGIKPFAPDEDSGNGFVQVFGHCIVSLNGRVEYYYSLESKPTTIGYLSNVLALLEPGCYGLGNKNFFEITNNGELLLLTSGYLKSAPSGAAVEKATLFIGKADDYLSVISPPVPDDYTKNILISHLEGNIKQSFFGTSLRMKKKKKEHDKRCKEKIDLINKLL